MTFLQLQNLVAFWLDDLDFGYFTNTQVKQWLNNGQKEIQKNLINAGEYWYAKDPCVQTTTVVNQRSYALPDDFLKVNRLEIVTSGTPPNENWESLEHMTMGQKDIIGTGIGVPQAYYFRQYTMVVYPAPDRAYTMRMDYTYRVLDMVNDNEVPDVPEEYHEYIGVLAAIDGLLKDGRDQTYMLVKKQQYEAMLKADAEERTVDSARHITITEPWNNWEFGEPF